MDGKEDMVHIYNGILLSHKKNKLMTFMEKAMAPYSSTLAWKISWTEEPGRLQSMGSLEVRHDWAPSLSLFTFMHWGRKWQPTPVFLPGESQGWGAWWAAVYGVAQSRTRLKWLSIMTFTATWMDLESVILSEVRHRKTHITLYPLYVEPKGEKRVQKNLFIK